MRAARWVSGVLPLILCFGCAELPALEAGICGNGFVEPALGEVCDGPAESGCYPASDPHACQLKCSGDASACEKNDPAKRTGWVCGLDEVCHYPSGQLFVSATAAVDASELLLSDLDGDGRKDIVAVGQGGTEVLFVGSDGQVEATQRIAVASSPPSAGRLRQDRLNETLAFVNEALGVRLFDGGSDRRIAPRIVPSFYAPPNAVGARLIATELNGNFGTEFVFAATTTDASGSSLAGSALYAPGQFGSMALYSMPLVMPDDVPETQNGPRKLLPHLLSVVRDPSKPCTAELLLAYQDDSRVFVAPLCDGGKPVSGKSLETDATILQLPSPLVADGGLFLFDVDADGALDLLVGARCGDPNGQGTSCAGMLFAKGNGNGDFSLPFQEYWMTAEQTLSPLAVADLNGDGQVDAVTRLGIHLKMPGPVGPGSTWGAPFNRTWTQAVTGDFNGDGRLDVAGIEKDRAGIDVFLNAGALGFNPFSVSTDGDVSDLTAGDFNGDFFVDLAFTMSIPGDKARRTLMLSEGAATGGVAVPERIGEVASLVQMAKADLPLPLRQDTSTDLALVMRSPEKKSLLVATAFGDGSSGLVSSLLLTRPDLENNGEHVFPLGSTIGAFGPVGAPALVALVGRPTTVLPGGEPAVAMELWNLPVNEDGLDQPSKARSVALPPLIAEPSTIQMLTVDLDEGTEKATDKQDEIVIGGYELDDAKTMIVPVVVVVRAEGNGGLVVDRKIAVAQGNYAFTSPFVSGDFDGDGDIDLLASVCSFEGTDCNVRWLKNTVVDGTTRTLELSAEAISTGNDIPITLALLQLDGDKPAELLALHYNPMAGSEEDALAWFRVDGGEAGQEPAVKAPDIAPSNVAVSGDVDGDNVDDLITATPGLITIYRGKDKAP